MPTSNGIPEAPRASASDPYVWCAPGLPLLLPMLAWALEPRLLEATWQEEAVGPQGRWPAPSPSPPLQEEPTREWEQAPEACQPVRMAGA